jgi:hypothetical protein
VLGSRVNTLTSCKASLLALTFMLGAEDKILAHNGKLTSWNTVLLEKLIVAQLLKQLAILYRTGRSVGTVRSRTKATEFSGFIV